MTSIVLLFTSVITLLLFQNCSKIEFTKETFSSELGNGADDVLRAMEPVLAVRGSGCIACHANVSSSFITDFGYGNSYGFGQNSPGLTFSSGSHYGDHGRSWQTSKINGTVIVPATPKLVSYDGKMGTLADYLANEEGRKPAGIGAPVKEVQKVFIGAPTAATLAQRFQKTGSEWTKFIRNNSNSPLFSGITRQPEGHFSNTGALVCDGDLYIDGTLLLDDPRVRTNHGCRIYTTGPIFFQGSLSFEKYDDLEVEDKTNLQLVSSRLISMGVGTTHCETASYSGHYHTAPGSYGTNPILMRLKNMWTVPGQQTRLTESLGRNPAEEGALLVTEALKIPGGLKDASCFNVTRRETNLERLLVNAPIVQSRYRGNFKGVMIAEFALASLGAFKFEFDPVFRTVPVVPVLKDEDFLVVE